MNKTIIHVPKESRCLIVEDSEVRLEWFARKMFYRGLRHDFGTTPQGAIDTLASAPARRVDYDIVFLDHDCNGVFFSEPTDPDFLDKSFWRVAQKLHDMEFKGQVIIHSGNPVGARRMAALLAPVMKVDIIPFGSFDIEVF